MPVFADLLPEPSIGTIDPMNFNSLGLLKGLTTSNLIICCLVCVFLIVCMWIIFKKAGRKGRESIIPYWNTYVTYKIAGKPARFWFLLIPGIAEAIILWIGNMLGIGGSQIINILCMLCGLVALVGLVLFIIMLCKLSKKFGKSGWFALGLIFLAPIFFGILAFGKAQYHK